MIEPDVVYMSIININFDINIAKKMKYLRENLRFLNNKGFININPKNCKITNNNNMTVPAFQKIKKCNEFCCSCQATNIPALATTN
ncbi:MAG: hypothetical protein GY817_00820 [bacterium]|nr:hypothetical protein [bacterium]